MSEYISVAEFANRAGISCQAVYQRLDKDLKPYLKLNGKRKTVSVEGLKLYHKSSVEQSVEQPSCQDLSTIVELLKAELETKNKQIEELNERLKESHYVLARFGIEDKQESRQETRQEQPKPHQKPPAPKKPIKRTPKGLKGLFRRK